MARPSCTTAADEQPGPAAKSSAQTPWEEAVAHLTNLPTPEAVAKGFREIVSRDVVCERIGDALYIDTPLVLQDGHFFRAYLCLDDSGRLKVSDGGFASRQFSIHALSAPAMRSRSDEAADIAREFSLVWERGEFSFVEEHLDEALRRINMLARAVDRSLAFLAGRATRGR